MKKIMLNSIEYELITNYKDGFDNVELEKRFTDYFEPYDYILGDWSYGKLRLKGFYDSKSKNKNDINNFENIDVYLKEQCAYDCKYFVIKKDES